MDDLNKLLLTNMLEHAIIYLNAAKEFYPFGGIINIENNSIPLSAFTGSNFPKSSEVISLLETAIADKFSRNEIKVAAIVSDTNFRETNTSPLAQAIRIKLMTSRFLYDEHYYLYKFQLEKAIVYDYVLYKNSVLLKK